MEEGPFLVLALYKPASHRCESRKFIDVAMVKYVIPKSNYQIRIDPVLVFTLYIFYTLEKKKNAYIKKKKSYIDLVSITRE